MSRLLCHSPRESALAARAARAIAGAHVQLRWRSIEAMRQWATTRARRDCPREDLLTAFRRAAARLPGTCLVRALALQRLLAEHGHSSELRIGVAKGAGGLVAHAWLVDGAEVLIGGGPEAATYTVLANWPDAAAPGAGLFR